MDQLTKIIESKKYSSMYLQYCDLIEYCKTHCHDQATEYYALCRQNDEFLNNVQTIALKELSDVIEEQLLPASSFSSKTNLHDTTSDLDIFIVYPDIKNTLYVVEKKLLNLGYTYIRTNLPKTPNEFYVYGKIISGVDIEVKVRPRCNNIIKLHTFLDNKTDEKEYITYLKFLTKDSPKLYDQIKKIIYNYGLHMIKSSEVFV